MYKAQCIVHPFILAQQVYLEALILNMGKIRGLEESVSEKTLLRSTVFSFLPLKEGMVKIWKYLSMPSFTLVFYLFFPIFILKSFKHEANIYIYIYLTRILKELPIHFYLDSLLSFTLSYICI